MTGTERPWLWSLPTRVDLAEGAVIQFKPPTVQIGEDGEPDDRPD